jgi:hypothetical protein
MPEKAKPQRKAAKPAAATKPAAGKATAGPAATKQAAAAKPAARKPAKAEAQKRLSRVPEQYIFYCCDGSIYRDLAELAAGLSAMTEETFSYHSNAERQDFCNWVKDVIEDIELAEALAMASSRLQAADCVVDRIALLTE